MVPAWLILLLRHSCQGPLWYHEWAGKLILLTLSLLFAPVLSWWEPEPFFLGLLRAFLFTLSFYFIPVCNVAPTCLQEPVFCLLGLTILWSKAPQAYLNYRGCTPFHWANQLECFLIYLWELRGRSPQSTCPMGFCHLLLCFGSDKGTLGSESDSAPVLRFTDKWYF